jgi:hypothetical protein
MQHRLTLQNDESASTKEHSLSFHYFLDYVTTLPQLHRLYSVFKWENEIGKGVGAVMAYFNVFV